MRKFRYVGRFFMIFQLFVRVILSYVFLDLFARLRGEDWKKAKASKLHAKNAQLIFDTIVYLEGVLIKGGQFMSTRVDVMPPEYITILSKLQDQVPAKPEEAIRKRLGEELGESWEDNFKDFNPQAIAAASLGQVHEAFLKTGERVAIKIQYPNVEDLVKADLAILTWNWRHISSRRFPDFPFENVISEARNFLIEELDYLREGKNAEAIGETIAPMNGDVIVPRIYWDFTTKTVLTMEYIDGVKISEAGNMEGVNREKVARLVSEALIRQILIDGLFHADPHGGNIMILPDSRVAFIDFGLAKRIDRKLQSALKEVTKAVLTGHDKELGDALIKAGFKTRDGNPNTTKLISYAMIGYIRGGKKTFLTPEEVEDKVKSIPKMMRNNPVVDFPKDFLLVGRVLMLVAGIGAILKAETDISEVVMRIVELSDKLDEEEKNNNKIVEKTV